VRRWIGGLVGFAALTSPLFCAVPAEAASTGWSPGLTQGSHGEAHSGALPSAPAKPGASCVSSTAQQITVTWTASAHATTYSIYQSTTSATAGFTVTATGITTTSWTSPIQLATGSYWFKVIATTGTKWAGAQSTATVQRTIGSGSCS
jgi:cellulose 1,4-beta-cellobiosidase